MASARGSATRRRSFAGASQCNFNGRGVWPVIAPKRPSASAMGGYNMARCWKCAGDLPDVSKGFHGAKHPCGRPPVTVHGVVFDILVGSESRVVLRPGSVACPAVARGAPDVPR